ncbi:MAG TPA: lysophospholipid acyltransferase family protein [Humibacillus xanthopallidus]|nr:lysophospholipid acyltransferase family protein [Humibacillus xanthopallidus]
MSDETTAAPGAAQPAPVPETSSGATSSASNSASGSAAKTATPKPSKATKKKSARTDGAKKGASPKRASGVKSAGPKKAATPKKEAAATTAVSADVTATPQTAAPAKKTAARPARGAFAAGAARASGERRRRSGTPLVPSEPVEVSAARRIAMLEGAPVVDAPAVPVAAETTASTRSEVTTAAGGDASAESSSPESSSESLSESSSESSSAADAAPAPRRRPTRASMRARRTAEGEPTRLRAVPSVPDDAPASDSATAASARATRPARPTRPPRSAIGGDRAARHTARGAGVSTTPGEGILGDILTDADASPAGEAGGWEHSLTSGLQSRAERLVGAVLEAAEFSSEARPGPAELVDLAVNVLRAAATSAGLPAEEVERQVADALAYLRRRLTGDYVVDEFGFDEDYTVNVHLPLLRPFYQKWFRVEVRGIENIPSVGGALVVGNHSGTIAMDSLMTQVAVYDEHPEHRHLRMLGADLVFQMPFVGTMARRSGSTLAANTDAERLLRGGELVGVWPEGFKGVGKPFSERYKLQRFGRGGFVSAALRAGVPIVPVSIVGAEEIYPILGNMPTVARLLGLPYAPITPTFPLLGPLGMVPLPSKWLIEFGPPIDTSGFGPEAADDPMLVFDLTDQVRETIQQTLYSLLMQRKSVFL